jgi:hypothetical protein
MIIKSILKVCICACAVGSLTVPAAFSVARTKVDACRSVHLRYNYPEAISFYNEVTADRSSPGTYFCACGFLTGYIGMQELQDGKKVVIFSIWEQDENNDPNAISKSKRVRLLYKDQRVRTQRFGNEGTGGQSMLDYDWKIDQTCRFLVHAGLDGARTVYTGYFYIPQEKGWLRIATFSTSVNRQLIAGYYSFVEDFLRNGVSASRVRKAHFGNGWIRNKRGQWIALANATFTGDERPWMNVNAGIDGDRFFLVTGGEIRNLGTPLGKSMTRPAREASVPGDLPAGPK